MPLTFDMPREKLATYAGTNPRPSDFDEFWDASLDELQSVDPRTEIVPADFRTPFATCSDLWFDGIGGARIHAKLLEPIAPRTTPHPAIVMFHGYSGRASDWVNLLAYAALGYTVAALDARGQGGQSEDPGGVTGNTKSGLIVRGLADALRKAPEKLYFRQVFLDTVQLTRIVMAMPEVDENRIGAVGGSQGGGLTLACAALEPRIRLAAPDYPFLTDYQRVWEIDLAKQAYAELHDWFRMFDPMHEREAEVFTALGYIDVQHLAPRIRAEVLMGTGYSDTVCPPSTQFAAYNKITAPKSVRIYPDHGHESLPGNGDAVYTFLSRLDDLS